MSPISSDPPNAFSDDYLLVMQERDDPSTAREAETSGPITLIEQDGRYFLFRAWESAEAGDEPLAVFGRRETALLFQAFWPALGRTYPYRLQSDAKKWGFLLEEEGREVGALRSFDPEAVIASHFLSYLVRTPQSLALLVEAAGPTAQKHLGRILGARVLGEGA